MKAYLLLKVIFYVTLTTMACQVESDDPGNSDLMAPATTHTGPTIHSPRSLANHFVINHPHHQLHVMARPGEKILSRNCVYNAGSRLNVCAALKNSSPTQIPSKIDIGVHNESLRIVAQSFGPLTFACVNPIGAPASATSYVGGIELPLSANTLCFSNAVCSKKGAISEFNAGVRICDAGFTTEIGLNYNASKKQIGFFIKGSASPDDVNLKILIQDSKISLELLTFHHQSVETILESNAITVKINELGTMLDNALEHFKNLPKCKP